MVLSIQPKNFYLRIEKRFLEFLILRGILNFLENFLLEILRLPIRLSSWNFRNES